MYIFLTNRLSPWSAREGDGIKPFMSSVFAWGFLDVCPAVWTAMCTCMYELCVCVCACAYWQYMLSLTSGWTSEHRAATASLLLGYQLWKLLTWSQMTKQPSQSFHHVWKTSGRYEVTRSKYLNLMNGRMNVMGADNSWEGYLWHDAFFFTIMTLTKSLIVIQGPPFC